MDSLRGLALNGRLFIDDFLWDRPIIEAWDCSVKNILEGFRDGLDADNNSPKRLLNIFSDFDIWTGESKAGFLLYFYFSRAQNRWFIVRTTIFLIGSDKDKAFQVLRVRNHAGFECKLI